MVIRKTIEDLQGRSTGFPTETRSTMHPKTVEKEVKGCIVESDLRVEEKILEKNGVGRKDKLIPRRECSSRECKKNQVHFIQVSSTFENTTEWYKIFKMSISPLQ